MNADEEGKKRGRKLPLFLLFLGPPGRNLAAGNVALRQFPGVHLEQFTDPSAALAWAHGKDLVAAIVDDKRPLIDGIDFLHELESGSASRPHTILVSDEPDVDTPGAAQMLGVDDIFTSSVPGKNVVALIGGAIGLRQAERASWEQTTALGRSAERAHPAPVTQPGTATAKRVVGAGALVGLILLALMLHPWSNPSPRTSVPAPAASVHGGRGGVARAASGTRPSAGSAPSSAKGALAPSALAVPGPAALAGPGLPDASGAARPPLPAGFIVLDATGHAVAENEPDVARAPASTLKLLTAVTALEVLGSPFRFTTRLVAHGAVANGTLSGPLALVGGGDPVLTTADVDDGISALARRGVRRIRGDLLIDATAYTGPDYNAHWTAAERFRPYAPGTSAVSIDEGVSAGAAVLDPQAFAGAVVRRQLLAHDITVDGVTRFGHADGGTVVWTHASSPLSALVSTMLRQSDNHIAEQLVREVGRASTGVGSEDAGLARMHDELTGRGISIDGLRLDDGSGLSLDNRMTPRTLAMLLASIARTPVGTQIYHALPRVGTGGDVVAKTGWVGEDEGLAGYLDHPPDGSYAFAFLGTGALGTSVSTLQAAQERQLQRYR